jgi:hypothetical protein
MLVRNTAAPTELSAAHRFSLSALDFGFALTTVATVDSSWLDPLAHAGRIK